MKLFKKILTVLLAAAMAFAIASPCFAVTPDSMYENGGDSYYIQNAASSYAVSGQISVYLYIYSGTYDVSASVTKSAIDTVIPVTLGTSTSPSTSYTVADVLLAAQQQQSVVSFDTTTPDPSGVHTIWMHAVKSTAVDPNFWFEALPLYYTTGTYYCGWMFRINGNMPCYTYFDDDSNSWKIEGYDINHAYVSNGDVINLYYSNVLNRSFATKPRAFLYDTNDSNCTSVYDSTNQNYAVTLQALQCECYTNSYLVPWTLEQWAPLANKSLDVIVDGSQQTTSTDANGYCTVTVGSTGTHTIKFVTTRKAYKVNQNLNFPKYNVPKELGLYCFFSN
ncbi:MAG: hypothetical protein K6B40_07650 [Firmicutes bacterium]|nr:hypothetical protein [Bacillota bacterium]